MDRWLILNYLKLITESMKDEGRAEEDAQKYKITKVIAGLRFRPIDDVVA
jgi:hypothetical protein